VAVNGASHGTSTRQTGVTGPRITTPVSPVVGEGDDPAEAHPTSIVAAVAIAITTCSRVIALCVEADLVLGVEADLQVRLMVVSATVRIGRN
jgi:hypothetical protein